MPAMNRIAYPAVPVPDDFAPGFAHHVFLIAIRGESHRGRAPSRQRAAADAGHPDRPGDVPPMAGLDAAIGPLPALPAPHRLARTALAAGALVPREVTGEILRDASGRLYERIGDHVRPVNRLYTGTRGEMIDLTPVREMPRAARPAAAGPIDASDPPPGDGDGDDDEDEVAGCRRRGDATALVPRDGAPADARARVVAAGALRGFHRRDHAAARRSAAPAAGAPARLLRAGLRARGDACRSPCSKRPRRSELGNAGKLLPLSYDLCRRLALSLPRPALTLAAATTGIAPGACHRASWRRARGS